MPSFLVSMLSSFGKSQSVNGGGLGLCRGADGMWRSRRAWITEAIFAPHNPETLQDFNLALFTMEACNNVIVLKERSYIQLNSQILDWSWLWDINFCPKYNLLFSDAGDRFLSSLDF